MASLFDEAKRFGAGLTAIPGRRAYFTYFLDVPGTNRPADLSVVSSASVRFQYEINVIPIECIHLASAP